MADFRLKKVGRSSADMNQVIAGILRRNDVPDWEYSFDGSEEQCQCLEKVNGRWQIYFVERGMKHGCAEFQSHEEAAREMISRLARTEESRKKMLAELDGEWNKVTLDQVRERTRVQFDRVAAKNNDQNGKPIDTVEQLEALDRVAAEQLQKMQADFLEERIQELTAHLEPNKAAAKRTHKSLSRFGTKKMIQGKMNEKLKKDLRIERPDLGRKG
jgi:hypothetical protein